MWRTLVVATMITLGSIVACGQASSTPPSTQPEQSITNRKITELPVPRIGFKPKLTLQQALRIAEKFIKSEKIDLSPYYLFEAKWVLYGTETKEPRWYFWWVNDDGAMGHYVEITVSMEGKPQLLGSM